MASSADITSTGTGSNAAKITLDGTGTAGSSNNYPVFIYSTGTKITSNTDVEIKGAGQDLRLQQGEVTASNFNVTVADGKTVAFSDSFKIKADNVAITTDTNDGGFSMTSNVDTKDKAGSSTGKFTFQQATASKTLAVGGSGSNINLSNTLITDIKSRFSSYSFGRTDGTGSVTNNTASWNGGPVTFLSGGNFTNAVATSSNNTILVRAGGDITLNSTATMTSTSSTANALVLSAGGDFKNNAGSSALVAGSSRWLVYSDAPADNKRDGLLPAASEFNKTYAANAPSAITGTDNRFLYATSTQPTLTYTVGNASVVYGEAYSGTPSLTYSSGLVGDDSTSNIGQTGSATFNYTAGNNVGSKSATPGTLANKLG